MESVRVVALSTLHKNGIVAQTFGKHFASDVKKVDSLPNVATDVFNRRVPVHIRQEPEAEPI